MTEVTKEFIQKNEDEKIIEIEIERLRSFKNHPFQVKDLGSGRAFRQESRRI